MSKTVNKHWYTDRSQVIKKVDRWVSRRLPHNDVGQESDWLGWDAWVRTEGATERVSR
jgi:hypothetical protein